MNETKKHRLAEAIIFAITILIMLWFIYKELYINLIISKFVIMDAATIVYIVIIAAMGYLSVKSTIQAIKDERLYRE